MSIALELDHDAAWHQNRLTGLGGSDASAIMSGDAERINKLWAEKRGESEPDDLSGILAVQMGSFTERLNLYWFARETNKRVITTDRERRHPIHEFMRCEIDGWVPDEKAIVEAKHVGAWFKPEEILTRYYWQLQHQLACAGVSLAYLTVFYGNGKWEFYEVAADPEQQALLITAEAAFWACVQDGTAPMAVESRVDISFDDMIEADAAQANFANEFASMAGLWLETKGPAKTHKAADKGLKDTMEDNVKRLHGYGVEVLRGANGARRIKEMTHEDQ
jgi:predicted phage-related endonuclease